MERYNEDNLFRDTSSPCAILSSNEVHPSRPQNSRRSLSASFAGITSLRSCPSSTGGSGIKVLLGRSFRTTEIISVRFTGAANPKSRREIVFGSRRAAMWRRAMSITSQKYSVFKSVIIKYQSNTSGCALTRHECLKNTCISLGQAGDPA